MDSELTREQVKMTQGIAIVFMLMLHLFATKHYQALYQPLMMIGDVPLDYYFALFGDCCVAIFCFCSGYGLMILYKKMGHALYIQKNKKRLLKLYVNFWTVLFLFVVVLGPLLGHSDVYPGDWLTFFLNVSGVVTSYNGAWWFFTTYVVLVLISPVLHAGVIKYNPVACTLAVFVVYVLAYLQRFKDMIVVEHVLLHGLVSEMALLGTALFPFVMGSLFADHKIYSRLVQWTQNVPYKNGMGVALCALMVVGHGVFESLFWAVFTGIAVICLYHLMSTPQCIDRFFVFLGEHSTNIWLIHMFFYLVYFERMVYAPAYSFLILPWLLFLCIVSSYVVMFFYRPVMGYLNTRPVW